MATEHPSPALPAPAPSRPYAKARPGYGKRTASGQRAPQADDFALMPERERYIAGYVDRLPEGAAMDIKSLAKHLPLYGQMAVSSALKALGVAGHLRRVRCLAGERDQVRWVSRTYWSRAARDNEWWDAFLTKEGCDSAPEATPAPPSADAGPQAPVTASPLNATTSAAAPPEPTPQQTAVASEPVAASVTHPAPVPPAVPEQRTHGAAQTAPSPAYLALARLGRVDARLALSAADCRTLEPLAAAWFTRGVNADYLTHALTAGLPAQVGSPVGLVRRRLTDKLPPQLTSSTAPATAVTRGHRLLAECTECGRPGAPEALPDGLCRDCRTAASVTTPTAPADPTAERDVHALVGQLRGLTRLP
ncbi:MarR family transcriptional regulator [Streptomyces sp. NBC_00059]|uniref:MarR family transcriptional regulator n=1 Tax=Streptomyces sp. NBC_00059 TaxID=2975635 RepID=UPI0022584A8D|nr:MarR family transcriptional regulator [Streptomyces sp. NBC_00059]MCX5415306.1 MarR family transcriptional regulator [Streptomyces sp. NBC_00059]